METPNLDHFQEILDRFQKLVDDVKSTTSTLTLSNIEREGTVLMSELQFTSPRLWNDFVSIVQKRRLQIATGQATEPEPTQVPTVFSEPKPRKKKTTKRKKK